MVLEAPHIVIEPPGPKAKKILERDEKVLMQSFVRWYPLVIKTGHGAVVEDVDGNKYIDLNSGIAVLNVGHLHPRIVEAIKRQAEKLLHYSLTDFYYEEAVNLAEKLISITPIKPSAKVFFGNSGAEAIEGAIKIARGFFKGSRPWIIAFYGAFHGRTMGANTLTASKSIQHKWFAPLLPAVIHAPYPYTYRCPFKTDDPKECGELCLGFIEDYIFSKYVDPNEVSAIFIEPIQGEGGYVVPPDNFLPKLRTLCDKYGILLIADEVQSGFGRSGKWWAIEHWNVIPDIITSAKAIASGLPLSAIIGRSDVMTLPRGAHATTFGGNPVACAAALAVIDVIENEKLLENATRVGEFIMKRFKEMMGNIELIGDVRGKGLMIGIELVKDRKTKEPARKELAIVLNKAFKRGVIVIGAGLSVIRIAPPLNIPLELASKAVDILEEILKEVEKESKTGKLR